MNLLDRAIAIVSPTAGLRRAAAREAIKVVTENRRDRQRLGGVVAGMSITNRYEAARFDRALEGWFTTGAAPDAEIGSQIQLLWNRARDLGRNNPFVARAYDLLASKMVGTGIRPRLPEEEGEQIRIRTMNDWSIWCDEADKEGLVDLYALQLLAARTVVESGEAIIRFDPAPGRRIPWTVRVLEPDYIDMTRFEVLENGDNAGGAIILGVEFSRGGEIIAYHMYTEHPGSDLFTRRIVYNQVERVPAPLIAPVFWKRRPEQRHGVPWISPSCPMSKNLDDLYDARLKRAKAQACFAAFVRKVPEPGLVTTDPQSGQRRQQLAPGIIEYLEPDEDVSFASPPQSEGDDEWQVMLLHAIAAGIGCTYSQLTGDLRQVNYSSMRAGALDFWSLLDSWQYLMLKPMMCRRMWQTFDRTVGARQSRTRILNVEWDFPDRPFTDPVKDGIALDEALKAGRASYYGVLSSSGIDPAAHIAQLKREHKELQDLNLPHIIPTTPTAPEQVPPATGIPSNERGKPLPQPKGPNGSTMSTNLTAKVKQEALQ